MPDETPASPAPAAVVAVAPPPAAGPQTVPMPLDQLQALLAAQTRLAEIEGAQRTAQETAARTAAEAATRNGQLEEGLRLLREQSEAALKTEQGKLAAAESRARRYALDGELHRALSAQDLASPAAAEQLATLLRGDLVVEAQGESFTVRTPTFQPVGDFVAQQLARPEYAHFRRQAAPAATPPTPTGAQVPTGLNPALNPAAPPAAAKEPANMGERVILHMQGLQKAAGDPRANMALPLGLRKAAT